MARDLPYDGSSRRAVIVIDALLMDWGYADIIFWIRDVASKDPRTKELCSALTQAIGEAYILSKQVK